MTALTAWEAAARHFEPPVRRWPSPLAMARTLGMSKSDSTPALDRIDRELVRVTDDPSRRLGIFMPPQEGKLIDHDQPVPTPAGWRRHGDLAPGDAVFHPSGRQVRVTAVSPDGQASLRVSMSDGGAVVVHPAHEWTVYDRAAGRWRTMETRALAARQVRSGGRYSFQLPARASLDCAPAALPLDPYALGVWLGDGSTTKGAVTHHADDHYVLPYEVSSRHVHATTGVVTTYYRGLWADLRAAGVAGDKHIPDAYLWASPDQRWALLCGLIDTDGSVDRRGQVLFANTNRRLAEQTAHLIRSLGYRAGIQVREPRTSTSGIVGKQRVYLVTYSPQDGLVPARLPRKAGKITGTAVTRRISITAVEPVTPRPGRCITVDSPDGLYLVGEHMTPTHNSESASRRFPVWLLSTDPSLRIAVLSYDDTRAQRWGRSIRRDLRSYPTIGATISPDSASVGRFETTAGGMVLAAGMNSGITGEPVDVVVIDDPVKGRREAESATTRESTWDVWENTILPRLGPGAIVVLMQTRWHTDDLAGRLLEREAGLWRVLSIPALAEEGDPLGREPGAELPSVRRRPPGYFRALSDRMSPYVFRSVYQQRPTSARGSMFLRDAWRYWHRLPNGQIDLDGSTRDLRDQWRLITVDLAGSTKTSADWTVAAAWALTQDGQLVLLDRVRERTAEADHWGLVQPLAERWNTRDVGVESTMMGTTLVRSAAAAGLRPFDLHADRDKITRALPYSHLQKQRHVWLPADAAWLDEWIGEHADFPNAPHDDQVDAGAYAARLSVVEWNPGGDPVPDHRPTEPDPLDRWDGGGGTDLSSAEW